MFTVPPIAVAETWVTVGAATVGAIASVPATVVKRLVKAAAIGFPGLEASRAGGFPRSSEGGHGFSGGSGVPSSAPPRHTQPNEPETYAPLKTSLRLTVIGVATD